MRTLRPGQRTRILLGGPSLATPVTVYETDTILLEAPNWTADGTALLLNGDGVLWRLDLQDPQAGPVRVPHEGLPPINNDHVPAPDGEHILMSASDGQIHRGAVLGGPVDAVTSGPGGHYLHGVSSDGELLAYVDVIDGVGVLRLQRLSSGEVTTLEVGPGHLDGPEFSPDGRWILLNTEAFTTAAGHAQLARIPVAGGTPERLVTSSTVNWFPHLAPDGRHGAYLSYPAGTVGHPADLQVTVTVVAADDWATPLQRYPLRGGQGTLNVNGWAPTSDRFALVDYPLG